MNWQAPSEEYLPDDAFRYRPPYLDDRLRHLIFLDGLLIDSWTGPVEGTSYWERAQELDRAARPRGYRPDPPEPPPHERVLEWLDSVVGGRAALVALTDEPLGQVELPEESGELCAQVVTLLERLSLDFFDDEFLYAARAALASLWRTRPEVLNGTPGDVAGALCWMVGRANGGVGAGTPVTQQVLKGELGVKAVFSSRATRFKECLRDLLPPPTYRPATCPNLLELGSPAYLTSATRRELAQLRDRALAAAATADADEQARQSVLLR